MLEVIAVKFDNVPVDVDEETIEISFTSKLFDGSVRVNVIELTPCFNKLSPFDPSLMVKVGDTLSIV